MKKTFWQWLADLWCRLMHPAPMWPVHSHYRCPTCWREYTVPWDVRPIPVTMDRVRPVLCAEHPHVRGDEVARSAHSW